MIKRALEPTYAAMRQVERLLADSPPICSTEAEAKAEVAAEIIIPADSQQPPLEVDFSDLKPPEKATTRQRRVKSPHQEADGQLILILD